MRRFIGLYLESDSEMGVRCRDGRMPLFFLGQKCRDVVWVPEVEVWVAEVFKCVGKSGFGGEEVECL